MRRKKNRPTLQKIIIGSIWYVEWNSFNKRDYYEYLLSHAKICHSSQLLTWLCLSLCMFSMRDNNNKKCASFTFLIFDSREVQSAVWMWCNNIVAAKWTDLSAKFDLYENRMRWLTTTALDVMYLCVYFYSHFLLDWYEMVAILIAPIQGASIDWNHEFKRRSQKSTNFPPLWSGIYNFGIIFNIPMVLIFKQNWRIKNRSIICFSCWIGAYETPVKYTELRRLLTCVLAYISWINANWINVFSMANKNKNSPRRIWIIRQPSLPPDISSTFHISTGT